jgi:hypothetical protein
MSRVLTLSDDLYDKLETAAQRCGLAQIDQLLEQWQAADEERAKRDEVLQRILALNDQMRAKYGVMPDSVELIREDRGR